MAEQTDVVAEFIKELVPKDVVEAAQLLVSLDYPIPDRKSLVLQLEKRKTDNPQEQKAAEFSRPIWELIDNLADAFKPVDFGIDTPRSALEKFFARTSQDCSCSSLPDLRPLGLPDFGGPGEPSPFLPTTPEQIEGAFGTDVCGRAAGHKWREHLATWGRVIGPSVAEYQDIQDRLRYCRGVGSLRLRGRCGVTADNVLALCLMRPGSNRRDCMRLARQEYELCRAALPRFPDPFGGGESPSGF